LGDTLHLGAPAASFQVLAHREGAGYAIEDVRGYRKIRLGDEIQTTVTLR
jgi:hypothetical protein